MPDRHHRGHGKRGLRWGRLRAKYAADKKVREAQHDKLRNVLPPDLQIGDTVRICLSRGSEIAMVLAMNGKRGTITGISEAGGYYVDVPGVGTHEFFHADLSP